MKKILIFLLVLFAGVTFVMAQPQKMTYQVVVRNSNNELVVNQPVGIQVSIIRDSATGPVVYRETHVANTNSNGLVSIVIGEGVNPFLTTMADVQWGKYDHYLQVDIDPLGGITYTITGTQQLMTVPYAFYAGQTNKADTALFAYNVANADTTLFSYNSGNALNANYANHSDTALYSHNAGNANYAANAGDANYADSAKVANYSHNAGNANYAANAGDANYADSAKVANYSHNAGNANYAANAGDANYADSAKVANYSHNAGNANYAANANHAIYSDTALYAHNSDTAGYSAMSNFANRADTADFNTLLNRPNGSNVGDMLYWDSNNWQVTPSPGSNGQVLSLDNNNVPQWCTVPGIVTYQTATVVTYQVNSYTGHTASVSGYVSNNGGTPFVVSGFCWSQSPNPTISNNYSMDGIGSTSFSHQITGLNLGTTYHFRAYAMNSAGVGYGSDQTFTTWNYPTVTTDAVMGTISSTWAYCGGDATDDGGESIHEKGLVWSRWTSTPEIDNNEGMTSECCGLGAFTSYMSGLESGETYYVRAYATNSIGTSYGNTIYFTTLRIPYVNTNNVTDIDTMNAVAWGDVPASGGDSVTDYGIVWGTYYYVDINNYSSYGGGMKSNGSGVTPFNFTDTMTNLIPGKYYYVRAYATNSIGTNYGASYQFRTNSVAPTVNTLGSSGISASGAYCSGESTYDGGESINAYGICYNTTGNPTISDSHTSNCCGTTSWNHYISVLTPATKYYFRAYATNSVGTTYGAEDSLTTLAAPPTVTTDPITDYTATTAVYGGNVTDDGGDSVTVRGVLVFTSSYYSDYYYDMNYYNYYIAITTDSSGLGAFSDTLKNLNYSTTYYVRAYATNSMGTSYGNREQFTTPTSVPEVTTNTVSNVIGDGAYFYGEFLNNGGEYQAQMGFCWDTVSTPVLGTNNYIYCSDWYNGWGLPRQYEGGCSGLEGNTTYWVRAYATNNNGTSYGQAISFTTLELPTVVTEPITDIMTTGATSGVTVLADGGNSVTVSGVCWSTSPTPTISNSKSLDGSSGVIPFTKSSLIFDLDDTTTYYVRAYATTAMGTGYGQTLSFTTHAYPACPGVTTVSDTDGNVYKTVLIGTQCWMRENLRTTKYPDGTNIAAGVVTETAVGFRYDPGVSTYGYVYNYVALMHGASPSNTVPSGVQGICPKGWHIPSSGEWLILHNYVNNASWSCSGNNGRALASKTGWGNYTSYKNGCYIAAYERPETSRNMSGLGLMAAGRYTQDGSSIQNSGQHSCTWSCSGTGSSVYYNYGSYSGYSYGLTTCPKYYGMSVRCIKDGGVNYDAQPCPGTPTVSDNDGHTYNTVYIGGKCWMKENLRTTKYPDGTSILYGPNNSPTTSTTVGYYYHVDNNTNNDATYGLLYNWVAATDSATTEGVQGICPTGWHIPTNSEFSALVNYSNNVYACSGTTGSAKALASTANWNTNSNTCAIGNTLSTNNATGLSVQPAGYYDGYSYNYFQSWAGLLSSTQYNANYPYSLEMYYSASNPDLDYCEWVCHQKYVGQSVRCIKD